MSRNAQVTRIVLGLSWVIVIALATGCGGAKTEAPPTVDPNLIYTQAAQTVAAQLTSAATLAPPATPTLPPPPPTQPAQMTWPTPTVQSLALPGTLEAPANPLPNTPIAPNEPTDAAAVKPDKLDTQKYMARLDYQDPPPGWRKPPGVKFDLVFTFTNLGDAEWNEKYTVRRYQGESFGSETKYTFDQVAYNTMTGGKNVKKNEQVSIRIAGLQAPSGQGNYVSHWRLCNNREDEGKSYQCFYLMEVVLVVQ